MDAQWTAVVGSHVGDVMALQLQQQVEVQGEWSGRAGTKKTRSLTREKCVFWPGERIQSCEASMPSLRLTVFSGSGNAPKQIRALFRLP